MATIFYGMSGEGRGHATRARTITEALRRSHRVVLFAPDCAYDLLAPIYRDTEVRVERIPGLAFVYDRRGRVEPGSTLARNIRYRLRMDAHVRGVLPVFEQEPPDLVLGDFEPILPRAARLAAVPFVSFDHQHYLIVSDLSGLPFLTRQKAACIAPVVRMLYDWQVDTIVSSFFFPPLKRAWKGRATQVGVLIRPELVRTRPHHGRHVLVYMRRHVTDAVLGALATCGEDVRLYGLGAREPAGRIRFFAFDERRFMEDLASCHAVVSTAGNQLVGEALFLRKPFLGIPEPGNFEQAVNGHFIRASGGGWSERALTPSVLRGFLERVDELRSVIASDRVCGNRAALAAIERQLPSAAPERLGHLSSASRTRRASSAME